jgi:hypothetical protein
MNKLVIFAILVFFSFKSAVAEENYAFNSNQKLRIATTVLISQAMSRGLSELGMGARGRMFVSNTLILGPAITSELLSEKPSKNNLISTGIGLFTSNLITISLDW